MSHFSGHFLQNMNTALHFLLTQWHSGIPGPSSVPRRNSKLRRVVLTLKNHENKISNGVIRGIPLNYTHIVHRHTVIREFSENLYVPWYSR